MVKRNDHNLSLGFRFSRERAKNKVILFVLNNKIFLHFSRGAWYYMCAVYSLAFSLCACCLSAVVSLKL